MWGGGGEMEAEDQTQRKVSCAADLEAGERVTSKVEAGEGKVVMR